MNPYFKMLLLSCFPWSLVRVRFLQCPDFSRVVGEISLIYVGNGEAMVCRQKCGFPNIMFYLLIKLIY